MESKLYGKQILFIGIGFYDYEYAIQQMLERFGAKVSYINSCEQSIFLRILNRLGLKKISSKYQQFLFTRLVNQTTFNNDVVFIIKGQNLTQQDIDFLHKQNPHAEFILYLWDSLVRHDNKELLLENFDNIWSFDRADCLSHEKLKFRPLFYRMIPLPQPKEFTISFIGWMHSDRLVILRKLRDELDLKGKCYHLKLYMGYFSYLISRYITRELKEHDRDLITFKTIPYGEFQRVMASSEIVLDIAHPLQSGLTMRTIETLAAGCHLLTSNADIVNYIEINPTCYTLFDREEILLDNILIKEGTLSSYFSLEKFVHQIFVNN